MDEKNFQNQTNLSQILAHQIRDPKLISLHETVSKSLLNPNKPPFIPKKLAASLSSASLMSSGTGTSTNEFSLSDTLSSSSINSISSLNATFEITNKNIGCPITSPPPINNNNNKNNIKGNKKIDEKMLLVDNNNNNNPTTTTISNDVINVKNTNSNEPINKKNIDIIPKNINIDNKDHHMKDEKLFINNTITMNNSNKNTHINTTIDNNSNNNTNSINNNNRPYNLNFNNKNKNNNNANSKSSGKMQLNKVIPAPATSSIAATSLITTTPITIQKPPQELTALTVSPQSTATSSSSAGITATAVTHREAKNAKQQLLEKQQHQYTIDQLMKLRPARLKPKTAANNANNSRSLPMVLKSINISDFESIIADSGSQRAPGQLHHNHHHQHHQHHQHPHNQNNKSYRNSNSNNNIQSDISILPKFAKTVSFTKRSQGGGPGNGGNNNNLNSNNNNSISNNTNNNNNNNNNSKFSNKQSDMNKSDNNNNNSNNITNLNKSSNDSVIKLKLLSNEDIKLNESENAWKPKHLDKEIENISDGERKTKEIFQKFRSILNKLTPENFNVLIKQVQQLSIDSVERLDGCIDLVFEKAISEPNFSVAYAQMCKEVGSLYVTTDDDKHKTDFRTKLITLCQCEFEKHSIEKHRAMNDLSKIESPELKLQMEEDNRKIRRRAVGTVRFIGELYKSEMLIANIMHKCILLLLQIEDEESLECLCKLLTTIGCKLEMKNDLSIYFASLQKIVNLKSTIKVSSRIRFMIQDLIDLKNNNWQPRNIKTVSNPKTMSQIAKEVDTENSTANYQQNISSASERQSRRKDDHSHNNSNIGSNSNSSNSGGNMSGNNSHNSGNNKNSDNMNNNRHSNTIGSSSYNNSGMKGNRRVQTVDGWSTKQNMKNRISFDQKKIGNMLFLSSNNDSERKLGQASNYIWNHYAVLDEATNTTTSTTSTSTFSTASHSGGDALDRERKTSRDHFTHQDTNNNPNPNNDNVDDTTRSRAGGFPLLPNSQTITTTIRRTDSSESIKSTKTSNILLPANKSIVNNTSTNTKSKLNSNVMTEDEVRELFKKISYEVQELKRKEFLDNFLDVPNQLRWIGVYELLNCNLDSKLLDCTTELIIDLLNAKLIKHSEYLKAIQLLLDSLEDLQIDIPNIWKHTGKYFGE